MRKLLISIAILVGLLFLQPPSAWAHAQLSDSYPKNNVVLQSMPTEVWIEFDGNLTEIDGANVNTLLVRDTSGKELQASKATVAGARIITKISNATGTGKIIASYRLVSEDGHPVEGAISFSIQGNELESPSPSISASSTKVHKETQPQVSPSKNEETKPASIDVLANTDIHANHNFLQRHAGHLMEFAVGFAILGVWFIYDRRVKK